MQIRRGKRCKDISLSIENSLIFIDVDGRFKLFYLLRIIELKFIIKSIVFAIAHL
jgi:hypothetical protein